MLRVVQARDFDEFSFRNSMFKVARPKTFLDVNSKQLSVVGFIPVKPSLTIRIVECDSELASVYFKAFVGIEASEPCDIDTFRFIAEIGDMYNKDLSINPSLGKCDLFSDRLDSLLLQLESIYTI